MKAKVYDHTGHAHIVDLGDLSISVDKKYMDGDYLNIFTPAHRVPDVWRYTILSKQGKYTINRIEKSEEMAKSCFDDRLAADAIGTRIILLIIESPHKKEYCLDMTPKGPAQGKTGVAIEKYLHIVLKKIGLPDGFYSLIVANPIQYMCSCSKVLKKNNMNTKFKNDVWKKIWILPPFKGEFIARISTYQPEYIINACTKDLKKYVNESLKGSGFFEHLFETPHPSVRWNTTQEKISVKEVNL